MQIENEFYLPILQIISKLNRVCPSVRLFPPMYIHNVDSVTTLASALCLILLDF